MSKVKPPFPTFSHCPTCGSDAIRVKRDDYKIDRGGRSIVVAKLPRHECPDCDEVLLGYDAIKRVEEARKISPRPSAAAMRHA